MSEVSQDAGKLGAVELDEYWQNLSKAHLTPADDGLSVICYAGMPAWFNRFLDHYQRKGFERLLAGESFQDQWVLDVGTGVGRWARWYAAWPGARVVGVDLEPMRLAAAREHGAAVEYLRCPCDELAFPDASFDVVSCVTVLQHVDHDVKKRAIAEFARVLKPGGRAVIFELTDIADDASHVFAWSEEQWLAAFTLNGLYPVRLVGEQYTPILRLLKRAYSLWKGRDARSGIEAMKEGDASLPLITALRLAVAASYPMEEAARFLPRRFARITGFLLRRESTRR
jgi:ubiquinone/menaquinone biosynthesis C-methylase UbiE